MADPIVVLTPSQLGGMLEEAAKRGAEIALRETRAIELTTSQAAEMLGVAPKTVRKMARSGRLPARRVGKDFRFKTADVDAEKRGLGASADTRRMLADLGVG